MIIGNGLIAKAFKYYEWNNDVIIFASGVSNSQNKDLNEFKREIDLLEKSLNENKDKLFIYISSCSIDDETLKDSLYVKHKINAENIIKSSGNKYLIFRTSNPVGFTKNQNTILNFLYNKIINKESFTIWKNAKRNLIDIEDLFNISKEIIDNAIYINDTINITNKLYFPILDIVKNFENITGKKAIYEIKDLGGTPKIDTKKIEPIINKIGINFNYNYLEKIIKKYYQ
ncbi:MAG: NAD-dependent epimerase [Candidatus Gracilibacteria bacterium]|nr:NAD-dependent epimerase [Candidatus Gracilibacteria bacterium]